MEARTSQSERERAHATALRLLTHRSRSVAEMRSRLTRKDFSTEVVEDEIDRLIGSGLLDDRRFAKEKAASLVRGGLGPRGILSKLFASGIDKELATAALDEAMGEAGGEQTLARNVASKRFGELADASHEARTKAARFLVRRGFSTSAAGAACGVFANEEI